MNPRLSIVPSLAILIGLALAGPSAGAKKEPIGKFEANVIAVDGKGDTNTSAIHINLYKWSTDEDHEEILDAIEEATENRRAYRAVPEALRKLGKAGYVFLEGGQGWPIRYARQIESAGKRRIFLAIDRPVTFSEIYRGSPVRDFDITIIVLEWEGADNGEGEVSVGTEVNWNDAENRIEITNFSSKSMWLEDVRAVE